MPRRGPRLGQLQVGGDAGDGLVGDVPERLLDVAEDVKEDRRVLGCRWTMSFDLGMGEPQVKSSRAK